MQVRNPGVNARGLSYTATKARGKANGDVR
jgi:hypothetical protein